MPTPDIDPCFRCWRNGRFNEQVAGRKAIPAQDDNGVWRDFFTGAPCDPPLTETDNAKG